MVEANPLLLVSLLLFGSCFLRPVISVLLAPALLSAVFCAFFGSQLAVVTLLCFLALLVMIPIAALVTGQFLERALLLPEAFRVFTELFPLLILLQLVGIFDGDAFHLGVLAFAQFESAELGLSLFLYVVGKTVSTVCGVGIAVFLLVGSWGVVSGLIFPHRGAQIPFPGVQSVLLPMAVLLLALFGEIIGEVLLGRLLPNLFMGR